MADYFVQIFLLTQKAALSDFKEISIDGTKIKATYSSKQELSGKSVNS